VTQMLGAARLGSGCFALLLRNVEKIAYEMDLQQVSVA
jgi:hypothetical protein